MRINIDIVGVKPISLNSSQKISTINGRPRMVKTPKTREFEKEVRSQLAIVGKKFEMLNNYLSKNECYLDVNYIFFFNVMTKKGKISKTSGDVDNLIKPFQDLLFEKISYDDSQIMEVWAKKAHTTSGILMRACIHAYPLGNIHKH